MNIISMLLLVGCIGFISFIAYVLIKDGKKSKGKSNNRKINNKKSTEQKNNDKSDVEFLSSQEILEFKDIKICNEEVALIQGESENEFIGIIEVQGLNFNLLSVDERILLEENFCELLNGIDFPIQFFIQSRKIDLDHYIKIYKTRVDKIQKDIQMLIENLGEEKNEELEDEINKKQQQFQYGTMLLQYFTQRTINANLLERKYYIVLKYVHNYLSYENDLSDYEILNTAYNDINNKASLIMDSLSRNKLKSRLLDAIELSELLYNCYNRDDASVLRFKNAYKARYDHVTSTAKPVEIKKLDKEIENSQKKEQELIEEIEVLRKRMGEQNNEAV